MEIEEIDKKIKEVEIISNKEDITPKDAKKFLKLSKEFGTDVEKLNNEIVKYKEEKFQENKRINDDDLINVISLENLSQDMSLIRKNLRENIDSIGSIINKFSKDLTSDSVEDIHPDILKGYADIVKSHTTSMKLLMELHKNSAVTLVEIKKLSKESKELEEEGTTNIGTVNNIVFKGTNKDMLELIKGKK